MSKWCIDPNEEVVPDSTYDENDAADEPLGPETTESSRPDALYGAPGGGADYDYEEEDLAIPPPPPEPEADEPFEQTESTYQEPVYDDYEDSASSALDTGYGSPTAPAPAPRQGGPRRGGNGGGPRRNNRPTGNRRKGNGGGRRRRPQGGQGGQRAGPQSPNTLYGAPAPAASAPLASYGNSAPLPAYGFQDELPSYGRRARRRSASSNYVPVYIPPGYTGSHQAHYYYN